MKRIYLYVPDGDRIDFESVVVWLSVGVSHRDQVKLTLLECYALDNDQFLRVRDENTDLWFDHHAKRLFPDSQVPRLHFYTCKMSVSECYRRVIDGTLEHHAREFVKPSHFLNTLIQLDPTFMAKYSQKPRMTSCPRGKRKYLSHSFGIACFMATLPITLGALVAAVDRLGELLINLIF